MCFLLMPHFLLESDEGGLSNYGVYQRTIVPYTLAFSLCGLLTLQSAHALPIATRQRQQLWRVLIAFGWLCFLIVESTFLYQVGGILDGIHIAAGIVLISFETITASWFGLAFSRDRKQSALIVAQFIGFLLTLLTFAGLLHVLFVAEVFTSLVFGILLIRTVRQAIDEGHKSVKLPHAHTA